MTGVVVAVMIPELYAFVLLTAVTISGAGVMLAVVVALATV